MKRRFVVMLAAACGSPSASPEEIARFVGDWGGGITTQYRCGTQAQQPVGDGVGIALARGTDADLQYTSTGGCLFKFRVGGPTATLSNAPVKCAAGGVNWTFTDYTLTTTDGVHATLNAAGGVVNGGGGCNFTMTGSLCSGPQDVCYPIVPPPQPPTLELVSGGDQTGVVGTALSMPIRVRVRAADGTPVLAKYVEFAVEQGGGSVSPQFQYSFSDGTAEAFWTVGPNAQSPQTLLASIDGLPSLRVNASTVAGPARSLAIASTPADLLIGSTAQLLAMALDEFGNVATAPGTPIWNSANPDVLAVSETGVATPLAFGSTGITVRMGDLEGFNNYAVHGLLAGIGTATIDAQLGGGEWDNATATPLIANGPNGPVPGRLYVMNDDTNLYLAVSFAWAGARNSLSFGFDVDGSGGYSEGDDYIGMNPETGFLDSVVTRVNCSGLCNYADVDVGGSNDGDAAFHNDASTTTYEFRHPLNSHDPHDFSLVQGSRIGMSILVEVMQASGTIQITQYPDALSLLQVTIR